MDVHHLTSALLGLLTYKLWKDRRQLSGGHHSQAVTDSAWKEKLTNEAEGNNVFLSICSSGQSKASPEGDSDTEAGEQQV